MERQELSFDQYGCTVEGGGKSIAMGGIAGSGPLGDSASRPDVVPAAIPGAYAFEFQGRCFAAVDTVEDQLTATD